MNFSFSDDQVLLRNSARALLDEHCKPEHVRAMMEADAGYGEALWGEMAKLGWLGLPFPEQYGGAGLGLVELALIHEEMGRTAYPGPFLATVVLGGLPILLGGSAAQKEKWLPAIASGRAKLTGALQEDGLDCDPDAVATIAARAGDGWTLTGVKRFVPWAHVADAVLVPARSPEGVSLFLVDPRTAGAALKATTGMDPTTRWSELRLDGARVGADALVGPAGGAIALLESTLRRAAVCASAEMLGAARRSLDMAVGYAKVREQFGQLIGTFQAIRHKCAEMLMEVENSHSAVYYAAWSLEAGAEDAAVAASICKSYVSDSARKVCGEAIQVHGGIGFTWEYDLHLYFKRAKSLEVQFGDAEYHRELIAKHVAGA
jgi:alkylation response protein AidB-like acyl-CoA dehydrogenase